jgi:hypothetical protein
VRARSALVAGLALVLAGCAGEGAATTTTVPTTTTAPPTTAPPAPPPGAELVGLGELEVGDCFDTVEDPAARDRAVWRVPCESEHRFEVYEVLDYDGPTAQGAYPGVELVQDWAEQACFDRFEAFVGVRWTISELDIQVWWPSADSWGVGDDGVICTVRPTGNERLTGSQRGVAR